MKIISKLLVLAIVVSSLVIPVNSAFSLETPDISDVEYPLSVEVRTDKSSYSALGTAKITVEITNISDSTVENISAISDFEGIVPIDSKSILSVNNISIKSNESYSYSYFVTAKPEKLNFFQQFFLLIKLLFIGKQNIPINTFNDGRNSTTEPIKIEFGSYEASDAVRVYYEYNYEIINADTQADFAAATTELVKGTLSGESFDAQAAKDDELYSCRIIAKYSNIEEINFKSFNPDTVIIGNSENTAVFQFNNRALAEKCLDLLDNNSYVEYVEPDRLITIDSSEISIFSGDSYTADELRTWGKEKIGADKYTNYLENNDKYDLVKVAVVDTGVDLDHKFLDGRLLANGYDFVNNDTVADDDNGHGTHVAGIIADCTEGLNIQIMPIKALDQSGNSYLLSVVNGIYYAVNSGADVINLSLGGNHSRYLDEAVQRAIDNDIVVCVAAGNGDTNHNPVDTKDICPAHIEGAITVAALDENNNIASFSNYGSSVDVAAPGVEIISAFKDGKYARMDGTSMAAPHVSAVAAMLLLDETSMTPEEIENKITSCCVDLGEAGKDALYGYGRIDLYSTVPSYTVNFATNGGSAIETKTVKSGETVFLKAPEKTFTVTLDANGGSVETSSYELNAELEGWYLDSEFETERIVKDGSYIIKEDTTFYAKWNNPTLGAVNNPNFRTGYTFNGWFDGDTKYTSNITVDKDITLKADWSLNSITVIFNGNGGTCNQTSKTVYYGDKYGTLPTPTRENAIFDGWYTAATGGARVTSGTVMAAHNGSVNIYAHWLVKKTGTVTSSYANADGMKLDIAYASTGYRYYSYGSALLASGYGTSFSGDNTPCQGTWNATTGLSSGGAVFEISNIDSVRSYIKGKGGTLSQVTVSAVRENSTHGMSSGTRGYMYAVSNRASNYGYGTTPSGTQIASTSNWTRGGTFTGSYTQTAVMNNFMGIGSSDYRSVMFYAVSSQSDYAKISSITVTFTYTYFDEE